MSLCLCRYVDKSLCRQCEPGFTQILNQQNWHSPVDSGRLEYIFVHLCTFVYSLYAVHFIVRLTTL